MKKIILTFVFVLLMVTSGFAKDRILFIEKTGRLPNETAAEVRASGHNEEGDVVSIIDLEEVGDDWKPTKSEEAHFDILIVDLTDQEVFNLLEMWEEDPKVDDPESGKEELGYRKYIKERKRKINRTTLNATGRKERVQASRFRNNIIDKSAP